MKVRVEILKNKKTEKYKISNKYLKFLSKRSKLGEKERYNLTLI